MQAQGGPSCLRSACGIGPQVEEGPLRIPEKQERDQRDRCLRNLENFFQRISPRNSSSLDRDILDRKMILDPNFYPKNGKPTGNISGMVSEPLWPNEESRIHGYEENVGATFRWKKSFQKQDG